MIKPKYLTPQIANYLEKHFKDRERVMLPEWEFEIGSISNGEVKLADANQTSGRVTFSMIATVEKLDPISNVTTVTPCRLVGVAEVTEYEGGKDDDGAPLYLPEISFMQITMIEEYLITQKNNQL